MYKTLLFLFLFSINLLSNEIIPIKNHIEQNSLLNIYYKKNDYKLLWINDNIIKKSATQLIYKINDDLNLKFKKSSDLKLGKLIKLFENVQSSKIPNNKDLIELDINLTLLYHNYMTYLSNGILNFKEFEEELNKLKIDQEIDASWESYSKYSNFKNLLYKSLLIDDLSISFNAVKITFPNANKLENAILFYENILKNGDFVRLPESFNLRLGEVSEDIRLLRQRLEQENLLKKKNCNNNYRCLAIFDMDLKQALIKFQENHGLIADGIMGEKTRAQLNTSAKKRIETILLNIERMKWLPRTLGSKYILVNIPEYKLKLYNKNQIEFNTEIIVGKKTHPTPIFSNKLKYIVLNPNWKIPTTIVKEEIIPKLEKNPKYLVENGINIHENWSEKSDKYNLDEIDFSNLIETVKEDSEFSFEGKFIQESSNKNPLGKVKFMFPNKYSVYLHDTPSKNYFNYAQRAYSHGCIRVNDTNKLLENLAFIDTSLNYEKAKEVLSVDEKEKIDLNKDIPVHIIYLTSWINEENQIQFREDIYGYDEIQAKLLKKNKFL